MKYLAKITSLFLVFLFSVSGNAQSFKKPHKFSLPSGIQIQDKKLVKPVFIPINLDHRALTYSTPTYKSISANALPVSKSQIRIQEIDANGYPARIRFFLPTQTSTQFNDRDWSGILTNKLELGPETGIDYMLKEKLTDQQGILHLKFDQYFDGMPVLDAEYFIHHYPDETVLAHGNILQPVHVIDPGISKLQAYDFAKQHLKTKGIQCLDTQYPYSWLKTGLQKSVLAYWYNTGHKSWHLVYEMDIYPNVMNRWLVLVDAVTGNIVKSRSNHCSLFAHATNCSGNHDHVTSSPQGAETTVARDLFDINRTVNVWREVSTVYLIDASRPMFKASQFKLDKPVGAIWTLDGLNSNPNNIRVDQIKSTSNTWPKNGISAHYNAGLAFEYFANIHTRNSINGKGGTIISVVNIIDENGGGLDNAFWNGEAMFYGNGAQAFNALARGLDVGGHEMSHGVIQSTANLAYEGESGAINESFADVFGVMIDRDDWKLGEDVVRLNAFPSGALRDMSNPHNGAQTNDFGRWQPKHVNEQYHGTQDNGGVHINSGIPNFAFYLFVQELAKGSNEEQGKKTAEKIYYKALSQYLTRSSQFKDLRNSVEQACIDLHGANSAVHNAAKKAFDQVGIGTSNNPGGQNYQKDLPVNPGKEFVVCTNNNNSGVYLIELANSLITQLSLRSVKSKPCVTDDGSEIYYVGFDSGLYALFFNKTTGRYEEFVLDSDPIYRNASISKDGTLLSVLYEQEENKIHVYEFAKNLWKTFVLTNPTTSTGVATSNVRYADFMDFDHSGQYLMYDCLSKLDRSTGGSYEYWDIGFLRVWNQTTKTFGDGHIEKLFTNLPENTSVGNPVYSKNSPYIMAFDYLEESIFGSSFSILAANIETGNIGEIAINRDDTGYPVYSVRDDYILYNGLNSTQTESLKFKKLATNKIQSNGPEELLVSSARWGNWFANGKRSLVKSDPEIKQLDGVRISPNPFNSLLRVEMESKSNQFVYYEVINTMGIVINQSSRQLFSGDNVFEISLHEIPAGIYFLKLKSQDGESRIAINKVGE